MLAYIQTYVHSAKNDTIIIIMVMKYNCNDYANKCCIRL